MVNKTENTNLLTIHERQLQIEELGCSIEQVNDKDTGIDMLRLSQQLLLAQTKDLIAYSAVQSQKHIESLEERQRIIEENQAVLQQLKTEMAHNNDMFDNLCVGMLNDPKATFEMMLKHVERDKKIADTTGKGWQWSYKFNFIARLKMAFKLLI